MDHVSLTRNTRHENVRLFLCHSLGGIVTKTVRRNVSKLFQKRTSMAESSQALIIRPTDEQQRAVQESTHGVIFMGSCALSLYELWPDSYRHAPFWKWLC